MPATDDAKLENLFLNVQFGEVVGAKHIGSHGQGLSSN